MTEHPPTPSEDDDFELELEPVDPEILEHERRRTIQRTRKAEDAVNINEVYGSLDASDPFEFDNLKKFRFSIRHLLIVTALLSVAMTIFKYTGPCNGTIITFALTVASAWWFIVRQERRQQIELARQKQELKARIAAQRANEDGDPDAAMPPTSEVAFDPPPAQPSFRIAFSLKELLGAFTAAALALGFVRLVGGTHNAAMLLGVIALLGLVLHAAGFDPPPLIVLCWWILLVLYLLIGITAAFSADQAANIVPLPSFEPVLALNQIVTGFITNNHLSSVCSVPLR